MILKKGKNYARKKYFLIFCTRTSLITYCHESRKKILEELFATKNTNEIISTIKLLPNPKVEALYAKIFISHIMKKKSNNALDLINQIPKNFAKKRMYEAIKHCDPYLKKLEKYCFTIEKDQVAAKYRNYNLYGRLLKSSSNIISDHAMVKSNICQYNRSGKKVYKYVPLRIREIHDFPPKDAYFFVDNNDTRYKKSYFPFKNISPLQKLGIIILSTSRPSEIEQTNINSEIKTALLHMDLLKTRIIDTRGETELLKQMHQAIENTLQPTGC